MATLTIMESLKADEWKELGKYKSGAADQISQLLEHFEKDLPDHVKEWLYNTRSVRRDEATASFQNALDIYKSKEKENN